MAKTESGIIDLLIEREDGTWALIEYKTDTVPARDFERHSKLYIRQVARYADAVCQLLEVDSLDVYIHYVQYSVTIPITPALWQATRAARSLL